MPSRIIGKFWTFWLRNCGNSEFLNFNSVQTRCIVKGEAQKSPLFWRFSGGFCFSQDRLFSRNSTRKPSNLIKSRIFTNTPCKSTCLYNAPSMHTVEFNFPSLLLRLFLVLRLNTVTAPISVPRAFLSLVLIRSPSLVLTPPLGAKTCKSFTYAHSCNTFAKNESWAQLPNIVKRSDFATGFGKGLVLELQNPKFWTRTPWFLRQTNGIFAHGRGRSEAPRPPPQKILHQKEEHLHQNHENLLPKHLIWAQIKREKKKKKLEKRFAGAKSTIWSGEHTRLIFVLSQEGVGSELELGRSRTLLLLHF